MFCYGMIPAINKPTRVTRKSFSAIDHVITNALFNTCFKAGIIKTDISDHFPIFFACKCIDQLQKPATQETFKRFYNKEGIEAFKRKLHQVNWTEIENNECPNKAYEKFLELFRKLYDKYFPKTKIKIKQKRLFSPWITNGTVLQNRLNESKNYMKNF